MFHAGVGSQLHIYGLESGQLLLQQTVLRDGTRLHGIECQQQGNGGLLLLHGGRLATVC